MKKNLLILAFVGLLVSCTQVEFCDKEHPHNDKLIVHVDWKNIPKTTQRPTEMTLFMWTADGLFEKQYKAPCDNEFIVDLPPVGQYKMMLMSENKNLTLIDKSAYETVKAASVGGGALSYNYGEQFVAPLGTVVVNSTESVFVNATVNQGVRPVQVKLTMNNASFLVKDAYVTLSGETQNLLLYKNEAVNVLDGEVRFPLSVGATNLSVTFDSFGVSKNIPKQILTVHINPKNGYYQKESIDITKYVAEFQVKNPNKMVPLVILADTQTSRGNGGFAFKIRTISVDGKEVDRGGDII